MGSDRKGQRLLLPLDSYLAHSSNYLHLKIAWFCMSPRIYPNSLNDRSQVNKKKSLHANKNKRGSKFKHTKSTFQSTNMKYQSCQTQNEMNFFFISPIWSKHSHNKLCRTPCPCANIHSSASRLRLLLQVKVPIHNQKIVKRYLKPLVNCLLVFQQLTKWYSDA